MGAREEITLHLCKCSLGEIKNILVSTNKVVCFSVCSSFAVVQISFIALT